MLTAKEERSKSQQSYMDLLSVSPHSSGGQYVDTVAEEDAANGAPEF